MFPHFAQSGYAYAWIRRSCALTDRLSGAETRLATVLQDRRQLIIRDVADVQLQEAVPEGLR
jgi:hypothetical protein